MSQLIAKERKKNDKNQADAQQIRSMEAKSLNNEFKRIIKESSG